MTQIKTMKTLKIFDFIIIGDEEYNAEIDEEKIKPTVEIMYGEIRVN